MDETGEGSQQNSQVPEQPKTLPEEKPSFDDSPTTPDTDTGLVATIDQGLTVPLSKEAAQKQLIELAAQGKLKPEDVQRLMGGNYTKLPDS